MRSLLEHKRKIKAVVIGEETYHVRSLTLAEWMHFATLTKEHKDDAALQVAVTLRLSVCDADGVPSFTDDDLPALKELDGDETTRTLLRESQALNGTSVADAKKN